MTKSADYVDYIYKTFYETIYRRECICGVMQKKKMQSRGKSRRRSGKISKRKAPFAGSFRLSCFSDYLVSVVSIVVSSMKFALLANFLTDSIADSAAALDLYPSPTPYMVPSTLKIL